MPSPAIPKRLLRQLTARDHVAKCQLTTCGYGNRQLTECGYGNRQLTTCGYGNRQLTCGSGPRRQLTECGYGPRQRLTRCEYEADIGRGQTHSGSPSPLRCVVWKHIPKSQRLDAKMGARAKACMMLGYVHDTTKIWRIWDPDFGKAVNCSDLYFDESQTAYTSCMADNERSGDPLGLPEEEPVVTEVMEDSSEAENPDTAPEQESNPAAVLDTPAVAPPTRLGTLEEAPAPDSQSEPDGVTAAIPSEPCMLTRSQSRRAARAGTALAAEVTTDDDLRS